ncbi:hypothetical protein EDD11_005170 [Mortierella claussenii]|nr:hypothetical protein EDD11_005170 [Mortierella claussenii]
MECLEVLDLLPSPRQLLESPSGSDVDATQLVKHSLTVGSVGQPLRWSCVKTLRTLRVIICGILRQPSLKPLHDDLYDYPANGPNFSLPNEAEFLAHDELRRSVCQVLGALTALEELALGLDENDEPYYKHFCNTGYQTQCLELSLDKGLCAMEGLKELKVLKITRMDHRVGLDDLQWMCEHWPNLEAVYGLLKVQLRKKYLLEEP